MSELFSIDYNEIKSTYTIPVEILNKNKRTVTFKFDTGATHSMITLAALQYGSVKII